MAYQRSIRDQYPDATSTSRVGVESMYAPRSFPQFGKSIGSLARTSGEIFGKECPSERAPAAPRKDASCHCSSKGGCGEACDCAGTPVPQAGTESPWEPNPNDENEVAWSRWSTSNDVVGWVAWAWSGVTRAYSEGSFRSEELGCGQATLVVREEPPAKPCSELSNMLETADCPKSMATCPVKSGWFWMCGILMEIRCDCVNYWRVMPEGVQHGYPGGSFGLIKPIVPLPDNGADMGKRCQVEKGSKNGKKCVCLCWMPKYQPSPEWPRGGGTVPCNSLGKKKAGDSSRWNSEIYASPWG